MSPRYNGLRQGFTLVELMVTLGIIAVLATVVLVSIGGSRASARDKLRVSELQHMQIYFRLYKEKTGTYPTGYGSSVELGVGNSIDAKLQPYGTLPADPLAKSSSNYAFMYNSNYTCGTYTGPVLYVQRFESGNFANSDALCGTTGSGKYIILLQ